MKSKVLLGSLAAMVLAFPVLSIAQAAAESALTNALSSSATAKAGSALGGALNQGSKQLGTRIQQRASSPGQTGARLQPPRTQSRNLRAANPAQRPAPAGTGAPMGRLSIQGGEVVCSPAGSNSQNSSAQASSGVTSAGCFDKKPASNSRPVEDKYKPFVTLPAPK